MSRIASSSQESGSRYPYSSSSAYSSTNMNMMMENGPKSFMEDNAKLISCLSKQYIKELEDGLDGIRLSYLNATMKYTRLQVLIRDLSHAKGNRRENILEELKRIAFSENPNDTTMTSTKAEDETSMGSIECKVQSLIGIVRNKLTKLSDESKILAVVEVKDDLTTEIGGKPDPELFPTGKKFKRNSNKFKSKSPRSSAKPTMQPSARQIPKRRETEIKTTKRNN